MEFILKPGNLSYEDIVNLQNEKIKITLDKNAHSKIQAAQDCVNKIIASGKTSYGINTGFGALANTKINANELSQLQNHIVLSHAAGVGNYLSDDVVRMIMILKINSLARGYSGVTLDTIQLLLALVNANIYPCIPEKGSVGASGDLAPLAHLSAFLLGIGNAHHNGKIISAKLAFEKINNQPLTLAPKEGLALINGTQASTALALCAFINAEILFHTAIIAGALTVDAVKGSDKPFDPRISDVRGFATQNKVADVLRKLLLNSEIRASHLGCNKVQDPYSIRCQPQVMGACLAQLNYAKEILVTEANAVSDNPLIFIDESEIISGGNFHAEPVAFAADAMAIAIAEIGALSERRIAMLIDPSFSNLPAFLVPQPGLNSGFMVVQVTACALASENKCLAHPASIDSLPTSANQEDHVSMATYAARRLQEMIVNAMTITGIELLAAAQGIDFLRPLKSSPILEKVHTLIRSEIAFYDKDRYFAPDLEKILQMVKLGTFSKLISINA